MRNLYALDIETVCGQGCEEKCRHALNHNKYDITVVGVWGPNEQHVFRDKEVFQDWLVKARPTFTGHNFKFDLKGLVKHGWLTLEQALATWTYDSQLLASLVAQKVPESYLVEYEAKRREVNKRLPKGYSHREGKRYSLKVLAPYFLRTAPFWEDPTCHDNDEYVLKDCEYTYALTKLMWGLLPPDSCNFFLSRLLPWTKLLLEMELKGIALDIEEMNTLEAEATRLSCIYEKQLEEEWAWISEEQLKQERVALDVRYAEKTALAVERLKDKSKSQRTIERYKGLQRKAEDKLAHTLNFDSPTQLQWALKDVKGLDVTDLDGKEGTGKSVLKRLAAEGNKDIELLLSYRKQRKLATSFFPSYHEYMNEGRIHTSFNVAGTRTGRLSSSGPNLQQQPSSVHSIFVADPGHLLATFDASAIEPHVMAYYTEDPVMFDVLDKGGDFHGLTACTLFGLECDINEVKTLFPKERSVAKTVGLAILYGAGANRIKIATQQEGFAFTLKECKAMANTMRERFSVTFEYREKLHREIMEKGTIYNLLGRPLDIPQDELHMKALNTLIQSSASDLIINSALRIKQAGLEPLLLVHDEIITQIPSHNTEESVKIIKDAMTGYTLRTDIGCVKLKVEGMVERYWSKA